MSSCLCVRIEKVGATLADVQEDIDVALVEENAEHTITHPATLLLHVQHTSIHHTTVTTPHSTMRHPPQLIPYGVAEDVFHAQIHTQNAAGHLADEEVLEVDQEEPGEQEEPGNAGPEYGCV